jgi:hypothetical protein
MMEAKVIDARRPSISSSTSAPANISPMHMTITNNQPSFRASDDLAMLEKFDEVFYSLMPVSGNCIVNLSDASFEQRSSFIARTCFKNARRRIPH